ncbi:para-nitrobenzyl esterase [Catenulispora sp. EB89]|uniref:carboxylesterase/lipase family protein n=1 Tax=Catenulispora sp. EB89 TaxID=3156257 RepID=UPI0035129FEB
MPDSVRTRRLRLFVGAGLSFALVLSVGGAAMAAGAADPGVVHTSAGAVRGTTTPTMDEYLGIPYAEPPTGAERWQRPIPKRPWTGVLDATRFGANCPQPASPYGSASTSEDCLHLNVYAPRGTRPGSRLPTMVWIHGGAFDYGESDDFDPAPLVAHGIVVVTLNYRLGALGFLASPALEGRARSASDSGSASESGSGSGDYGLLDQQLALRWVQSDIAAFGGDRDSVTLAGESAGGLSVLAQVVSPRARGLFRRAIVESGTYQLEQDSLSAAEAKDAAFVAKTGCANAAGGVAACLRGLPVATILADQNQAGYRPNVDPDVLPSTIGAALQAGSFGHVQVLLGTNKDEFSLFVAQDEFLKVLPPVTAANYVSDIATALGVSQQTAIAVAQEYPVSTYPSPQLALTAVGTDGVFACNAVTADEALARHTRVYGYQFSDEKAPQRYLPPAGFPQGASHTSELSYLFDVKAPFPGILSGAQVLLADQMQQYWTGFVKDARPRSAAGPRWPRMSAAGAQPMINLATPAPVPRTDFAAEHHCAFWNGSRA